MNDVTILVLSCDKYADLWKPFFMLFRKYWPKCPYPVVLGSNTKKNRGVPTILSGPDRDWSTSLLKILSQITTPHVFIWLDDIFPISRVSTQRFKDSLRFMNLKNAKHIHVYPVPKPDHVEGLFGIFDRGAPYRATALGFWDRKYLMDLLLPGESPWKFEVMGSYRSCYDDGFYCHMQPLFNRLHVVEKGKIFRDAYDYLRRHNITVHREVNQGGNYIISNFQSIYFNTIIKVPWRIRVEIMNVMRKLLISY